MLLGRLLLSVMVNKTVSMEDEGKDKDEYEYDGDKNAYEYQRECAYAWNMYRQQGTGGGEGGMAGGQGG